MLLKIDVNFAILSAFRKGYGEGDFIFCVRIGQRYLRSKKQLDQSACPRYILMSGSEELIGMRNDSRRHLAHYAPMSRAFVNHSRLMALAVAPVVPRCWSEK